MFNQKTNAAYYDVYPRVFLLDKKSEITISPRGNHVKFNKDKDYLILIFPLDSVVDRPSQGLGTFEGIMADTIELKAIKGKLTFSYTFKSEQEHIITVCEMNEEINVLTQTSVYCLKEDLYHRRPYKIEAHSHTNYSDGKESPDFVPSYYRMMGYDILAITDHREFYPSQMAIDAFSNIETNLTLFTGEEVHAPFNTIHIINFGGSFSVNEIFKNDFDKYDREVKKIIEETDIPKDLDPYKVASCIWVSKNIRQGGGLCILGHPFYRPGRAGNIIFDKEGNKTAYEVGRMSLNYNVPSDIFIYLLRLGIFDAWEICGFSRTRNNGHLSLYLEMLEEKLDIPVVAANDSHGVAQQREYFDKVFTIVFSKDKSHEQVLSNISKGYCLAVENHYKNERMTYGKPRLMRYGRFLIDYFYPAYEEIAFIEGKLLKDYVAGIRGAKEELERISIRARDFMDSFFSGKEITY